MRISSIFSSANTALKAKSFSITALLTLLVCFALDTSPVEALSAMTKPRILCLHGKAQTAESFSKKIGGARRKLERRFDLTFLDGPIDLEHLEEEVSQSTPATSASGSEATPMFNTGRAWFLREPLEHREGAYRYLKLKEAMEYISDYASKYGPFDGVMGFSQGGTVATAMATSGAIPVRAVLTAGAPHIEEVFASASEWAAASEEVNHSDIGLAIPKLHLAGTTDAIISVESTNELCRRGGNGELIEHDKGHMFPTKAVYVDKMVEFLQASLQDQ
jgi:predicted esterase